MKSRKGEIEENHAWTDLGWGWRIEIWRRKREKRTWEWTVMRKTKRFKKQSWVWNLRLRDWIGMDGGGMQTPAECRIYIHTLPFTSPNAKEKITLLTKRFFTLLPRPCITLLILPIFLFLLYQLFMY